jgi:hypothetical protein
MCALMKQTMTPGTATVNDINFHTREPPECSPADADDPWTAEEYDRVSDNALRGSLQAIPMTLSYNAK